MVSPQMGNGAFNGSFLVLNLGSNTVGLGNSSPFPAPSQAFHPVTAGRGPDRNVSDHVDSISVSTDDASSASESRKTRSVSKERDDPDWVPAKKVRKSSSSTCRTIRPKPQPSISARDRFEAAAGGGNGVGVSSWGAPPQYLFNLLSVFGWRVVFRPGPNDYIYISPAGLAYTSISKAFETFLASTSKYEQKAYVLPHFSANGTLSRSSVQQGPTSGSNLGLQSEATVASDSNKKGGVVRRKRSLAIAKKVQPSTSIEEHLPPKDDHLSDNGKKALQMQEKVVAHGANQVNSFRKVVEKSNSHAEDRYVSNEFTQMASSSLAGVSGQRYNHEMVEDGNLLGAWRSARTSGQHFPLESAVDNAAANDSCQDRDKMKVKQQYIPATSQAEILIDKLFGSCEREERLNIEVRKSGSHNVGVKRNDQSNRCSIDEDKSPIGVRRFERSSTKKNIQLNLELDAEVRGDSSCVIGTTARKEEREPLIQESMLDENLNCSINVETLSGEAKSFDCSNTDFLNQANQKGMDGCGDIPRIRRSTRINGKRVPVDNESDTELWFDDYILDQLEFATSYVAKEEKKTPTNSLSKVNNADGGSPNLDVTLSKESSGNMSDCQKLQTRSQMERNSSKKNENAKSLMPKQSSASVEEINAKIPAEKCSLSSSSKRKPAGGGKKKRKAGCSLMVRRKARNDQAEVLSQEKVSILSWLIYSKTLTENEKIIYIAKDIVGKVFSGVVTRGGIWCSCCREVVPFLKFVAHAGGNLHQPWDKIFLLSGKTLLMCVKEAWEKEKKQRKVGFQTVGVNDPDPSDDTCGVCADGGHLICCDGCPSTFHQNCMMLKSVPEGSWFCPYCRCMFCMVAEHGSDKSLENLTLITCKQCGRKYHQECAYGNGMHTLGSVPSFCCGENCKRVAAQLSDLHGKTNTLEGGFSWTLLKCINEDEGVSSNQSLAFVMESNVKLAMALFVLDECFVPLVDQRTGVDMISQAVYNCGRLSSSNICAAPHDLHLLQDKSNFNRLNYERFYTLVLEKDEEIISVASLRLHGTAVAEMPFIGTRPIYQRQGMCRRLVKAVEHMLALLQVEKLIIPAIPELLETWMTSFSFKPLEPSHKDEIKDLNIMIFAGTTLLQKPICSTRAVGEDVMQVGNGIIRGKSIQKNHEPQRSFGGQLAGELEWTQKCNLRGQKDATPEPCRMIKESSVAPGSFGILHPKNYSGSISESLGQKDATPEPCRMEKNSSFAPSSFGILHPENHNGSITEPLPASSTTFVPNLNMAAPRLSMTSSFFPPIDAVLDNDPLAAGISRATNTHTNSWFQNADEAKDLQMDAINSTLSFDRFLRI